LVAAMNDDLTPMDYVKAVICAVVMAPVLYAVLVFWLAVGQ
jgi:ATP-dependent Clp protease adapter protein ClpS